MTNHKITDKRIVIDYLEKTVKGVYKVLCLYEEENVGVKTYAESLLFTLYNLQDAIDVDLGHDYVVLVSSLEGVKKEMAKKGSQHTVIKRETFKCMSILNGMIRTLKEEVVS